MTDRPRIFMVVPSNSSWIATDIGILRDLADVTVVNSIDQSRQVLKHAGEMRRADLVFFWFGSLRHFPFLLLAWILRKKILIVAGGYDVARMDAIGYGAFTRGPVMRFSRRLIFCFADVILAVSRHNEKQIEANLRPGRRQRVKMIYLSAGVAAPMALKPWAQRPKQVAFLLSAAGADVQVKGVDRIPELCKGLPDVTFKMAGYLGPDVLEQLRAHKLANLHFVGLLKFQGPEFVQLLNDSRVILSTSRTESFGAGMVDGAALGCVPVAFAVGALPEVIEGIGRIVANEEVPALVVAVREVIGQPDVDVNAIRAGALSRFPVERRASALKQILTEMAVLPNREPAEALAPMVTAAPRDLLR